MPPLGRILEGLVTTLDAAGQPHLAPMGPIVDDSLHTLCLRPFQTSTTFQNLQRTRQGVLHVTDDVELLAQAAVGKTPGSTEFQPASRIEGRVLVDCCRWYEFRVTAIDATNERCEMTAEVVAEGSRRDFFGFNRAMHAVLELAILATRVRLLPPEFLWAEIERLAIPVQKTAGPREARAFEFLKAHLRTMLEQEPPGPAADSSLADNAGAVS